MKKNFPLAILLLFSIRAYSQTWEAVGGNVLGNDIHGFGIWNNQLAMGGSFNGNPCDKVAAFDSTSWFCPAGGIGSVVRSVISYSGNLVACGDFWNVNQPCTDCNGVAMWNGTGWTNLGTGFNNDVLCMTVWNGNLVAGGDFTTADGNTCYRVAMWNGTSWGPIGGLDTAFNNDVRALAVYNGELWVGGDFSNVNGCSPCDRIVKWDGTAWVGGNSGVDIAGGLDSTVRVLYVDPVDNLLYMGGHFIEVGGNTNCSGVAYYDGSAWFAMGTGVDSYVRAITRYNGNIIVGGDFLNAGGSPASRVAKWSPAATSWSVMSSGMDAYLRALTEYKGELYAGGSFHNAGGQTRDYIAKWYETPSAPPVANFSISDNSICLGQCVDFTDLSSGSPSSWSWTFSGGTPNSSSVQDPVNICFSTAGTKTVTLQACNLNGCNTTTQTLTVSNNAPPVVAISGSTSVCSGQSSTLTASGASNYAWSPATGLSATTGATVTAGPSVTTSYTVTGTTGNCSGTTAFTIIVNPTPTVAVSPPSVSICTGSSATLTASGANSYTWTPSTGLSASTGSVVTASPASTITYTVTGTETSGCSASFPVTVNVEGSSSLPLTEGFENLPFLPSGWNMFDDATDSNMWQHNIAVGGFGASTSCAWYPNNIINAPGTKDEMRTMSLNFSSLSTAQMFFDVAYCRKNNASFSDTLSIYASTDCGQTWNEIYSKGGSTLATAPSQNAAFTPAASEWRTDTINLNLYAGQSKVIFAFQNRNYNGNNLYLDNINISGTTTNPPAAAFSMSADTICPGDCVTFTDNTAGIPTSWSWTFAGGSPSISSSQNPGSVCFSAPGTYSATLRACNANGCDSITRIVEVSIPNVDATVNGNDTICYGGSIVLNASGAISYQWTPSAGLSCTTCAGPVASPTATTMYYVSGTDAFGCTNSDSIILTVENCLGIESEEAQGLVSIYPNPVENSAVIEISSAFKYPEGILLFVLYDIFGREVKRFAMVNSKVILDRENLVTGIYFWKLAGGKRALAKGKLAIE